MNRQPDNFTDVPPVTTAEGQTDLSNARRFRQAFGDNVRFCFAWGRWLVWEGTHWSLDNDGSVVRLAKAVADKIWEVARAFDDRDSLRFAAKTAAAKGIASMLELAKSELPIRPEDLDQNAWLFNCPNGTVDLRTGELRGHRREDYITKLCPTEFDANAPTSVWDVFLQDVFDSQPIVEFVQRLLGYALTGDQREQVLPIFWGDGSNGKSTLLNAFMHAVGDDYAMQASPDLLMVKRGEVHPTGMADLFGKRIVACVETDEGRRLSEALVKMLTGGENVRARRMREDFWEFAPTHTVFLATNHKPEVRGDDHAIWRRIALVPFVRRFWNPDKGETGPPELKQDKSLPERLKSEAPGILAWAVRGCRDWIEGGLRMPAEVRGATEMYQTEQDIIASFIADSCLTGSPCLRTRASQLYAAYKQWAESVGEKPLTQQKFGRRIHTRPGISKESSNGVWYVGIGLRDDRSEL